TGSAPPRPGCTRIVSALVRPSDVPSAKKASIIRASSQVASRPPGPGTSCEQPRDRTHRAQAAEVYASPFATCCHTSAHTGLVQLREVFQPGAVASGHGG